jgi:predicted O-methyltransferase YrrM
LEDPALATARESSAAARLPAINVSPLQGMFLQILARGIGARSILEIGALGGYSAIWLARALPSDGRFITLEIDPRRAALSRQNLERAGLSNIAEVRIGAAVDLLSQLAASAEGPFDLVFIDADKANLDRYFSMSLGLCRPGSLLVVDNVVRGGAVLDADSSDPDVQGVRRFLQLAAADPRVQLTALQTVGAKGYDGFAVARVVRE